jgi:valyl-tRNA synthetase
VTEARDRAVKQLRESGHLVKIEPYTHQVGHCQRSGCVVEPMISEQWFCRMTELVKPAINAIKEQPNGARRLSFYAPRWYKVYLDWLNPETIQDWCISRQLWWGHRIPAWYCDKCGHIIVSTDPPDRCEDCDNEVLRQDPDVLDTWFSSWLWPLTTLGWPEETEDLKRFYPTDFLLTAYDIIFFWVARMVIAGYEFRDDTPFYEVVYTGLIRDEHGKKMSKSAGNAVDPLLLIDEYGRDALRFTLTHLSFSGSQDINLTPTRLQGSRYFMNKLWNVAKYVLASLGDDFTPSPLEEVLKDPARTVPDRWLCSRLVRCAQEIDSYLKIYDFGQYASTLYDFVWTEFCDWYVEISKFHLTDREAAERKQLVRSLLFHTLETILRLLHPISPYISEELHAALHGSTRSSDEYFPLIVATWPCTALKGIRRDEKSEARFEKLMDIVRAARNLRKSVGLADSKRVPAVFFQTSDSSLSELVKETETDLASLVRAERVVFSNSIPDQASISSELFDGAFTVFLPLDESIDIKKEVERLESDLKKKTQYLDSLSKKLNNPDFIEKAPPKVLEKEREKHDETGKLIEDLQERLRVFKGSK